MSEARLKYSYYVLGFSHCIEVYGRNSSCYQSSALLNAPFDSCLIYSLLAVASLSDGVGKTDRYINGK